MNQLLTHESKSIDTAMQSLKKANNWLSSFIESYSPPLDGERYLTDKELSEHLKLSRRTLQEYRRQGILPYIILCGKTLYPESEIQALLTGNYRKPIIDGTVSQGGGYCFIIAKQKIAYRVQRQKSFPLYAIIL